MGQWLVEDSEDLVLEDVIEVRTSLVGGDIAITAAEGPARLEVKRIEGPPVEVTFEDGVLTIGYESDFSWPPAGGDGSFLGDVGEWASNLVNVVTSHEGRSRSISISRRARAEASVAISVPPGTSLALNTVSADILAAGIAGPVTARTLSGDATLDGVSGAVRMRTASGDLEAQGLTGELLFNSASGDVTLVRSSSPHMTFVTVSGDVTFDSAMPSGATFEIKTVSGDIAISLPTDATFDVDAMSVSGRVDAGPELTKEKAPGRARVSGRVGDGDDANRVKVKTVSGDLTVVRRTTAA
jgi:hypothetical protein